MCWSALRGPQGPGSSHSRTGSSQLCWLGVRIRVLTGFASDEFPHPAFWPPPQHTAQGGGGSVRSVSPDPDPMGTGPPLPWPGLLQPRWGLGRQHRTEAQAGEDTQGPVSVFNTSSGFRDPPSCASFSYRRHLSWGPHPPGRVLRFDMASQFPSRCGAGQPPGPCGAM